MRTSYFSYSKFSVNTPQHRHVDYNDVQPNNNLYHSLYFTLNVKSDTPDNNGDENDVSIDTALSCIQSNNALYESDFVASIAQNGDNDDEYMVCLELPLLRVQEQLTADALVMSFVRFEDALYNILAHHRNGEDYDNDNELFYAESEDDNQPREKLYVDGQLISTDDMHSFMLNVQDTLLSDEEKGLFNLTVEYFANGDEATSPNIENQILRAYIKWHMQTAHRQHFKELAKNRLLMPKIEKDCNSADMALIYKS